jgi:hypothetical protein
MKKAIHIIVIILVVTSFANNHLFAQKNHTQDIKISGHFNNLFKTDTGRRICINYNTDDWFSKSGFHTVISRADSSGNFEFSLPNLGKPYKINLFLRITTGGKKYGDGNLYYVESGDDVHIKINLQPDGQTIWDITGIGSEKYNLAKKIYNTWFINFYDELNALNISTVKDTIEVNDKLERLAIIIKKFEEKKTEMINSANISPIIKVLLSKEFDHYDGEWNYRTEELLKNHPDFRDQIAKVYLRYSNEFYNTADSLSALCPVQIVQTNGRIKVGLMIENRSNKVDMISMYNYIKNNFSGYLRERLIGDFVFNRFLNADFTTHSTQTRDSIYNDALSIVQRPNIKQAIDVYISELVKVTGEKNIIEAVFIDLKGNKIHLNSLKGKVILIDAWFNGCSGCVNFHKAFESQIYPNLKNNKNFVVLSINVDRDMDRWKRGISGNLYTSKHYINVTTANWFDDPFMKYYGVNSAPFTMLVDAKGVIRFQPKMASIQNWIDEINNAINSTPKSF